MPEFNVALVDGRRLRMESPDLQTAQHDAAEWAKANPPTEKDPLRGEAYQQARIQADRGGALNDIGGAVMNFTAGIPFFQDVQAGLATAVDPTAWSGRPGEAFRNNRERVRANTESYAVRRPAVSNMAKTAATGATILVPGGGVANTARGAQLGNALNTGRAATAGRMAASGAASGAVYGAGADGTMGDRAKQAGVGAALGAALGAGVGAIAPGAPQAPTTHQQKVATLLDNGVSLTPGQRAGGLAKNVEDLAQRAPLLGPAISGARERGVESLNRSVALRALDEIGEGIPPTVRTGNEAVAYVRDRLGATYDRAADLVPRVAPDQVMATNLTQIAARRSDLADSAAQQFERIVRDRIGRLQGGATGRQAMAIADELEGMAAPAQASDDLSQQLMGTMLRNVAGEIRGLISRASPEAERLIQRADAGYTIFARLRNAASKGKDGVATPGQLRTAVRVEDNSVGKGRVATGEAALYDLSNASNIMPDQFGNPGSANAMGLGALLIGGPTAPVATAATAAGLGAASAPYMAMARQVLERLPANPTRMQMWEAQRQLSQLATQDPNVRAMQQALALRLGALGGATTTAGGAQ